MEILRYILNMANGKKGNIQKPSTTEWAKHLRADGKKEANHKTRIHSKNELKENEHPLDCICLDCQDGETRND